MENLSKDMTSSLSNNMASQLLTNIKGLQTQLTSVNDAVNKLHVETQNIFSLMFNDFKR